MTVEQAFAAALALGLTRLDAALLLAHQMKRRREWLIAHSLEPIEAPAFEAFEADCRQRAGGVPIAYLIGRREFMGLELGERGRAGAAPETETLAQWASNGSAAWHQARSPGDRPRHRQRRRWRWPSRPPTRRPKSLRQTAARRRWRWLEPTGSA